MRKPADSIESPRAIRPSGLTHEALRLAVLRFRARLARRLRFDNNDSARSSSFLRDRLNPRPPRFMKYVSIRMPD